MQTDETPPLTRYRRQRLSPEPKTLTPLEFLARVDDPTAWGMTSGDAGWYNRKKVLLHRDGRGEVFFQLITPDLRHYVFDAHGVQYFDSDETIAPCALARVIEARWGVRPTENVTAMGSGYQGYPLGSMTFEPVVDDRWGVPVWTRPDVVAMRDAVRRTERQSRAPTRGGQS